MRPLSLHDPATLALLERYVANECDALERATVEATLRVSPGLTDAVSEIRARVVSSDVRDATWDGASALETFWRQMRAEGVAGEMFRAHQKAQHVTRSHSDALRRGFPQRQTMGVIARRAAAVAGLSLVAVAAFVGIHTQPRSPETTRTYTAQSGQTAAFTLRDGTRVLLAPNSMLRVARFGTQQRTVTLDGEAYFDVAQSTGAPFIVNTKDVSTRVLGTAFLVRHYRSDAAVRVAVTAGRVSVTTPRSHVPALLVAGNVGEVSDSTVLLHSVDNLDGDAQWVGGRLVFNDAPVTDVLTTLTRWYGYEFRCADSSVARQNVTVWLSSRSSSAALATLSRLLDVSLTVAGDTVTLTPQHLDKRHGTRHGSYDVWTPTREVGR